MSTDKNETSFNNKWRPAMGWLYLIVCMCDFILFPIGFTLVQFYEVQAANDAFRQWNPITLMGAGFFHISMGAVLGITSYGRTKEKMNNVSATYKPSTKINSDERIG